MDRPTPPPALLQQADADHRLRWQPHERLHHLFEARCDAWAREGRAESAAALQTDEGSVSYAELDRRANRLARHLRDALGLCPGERVALLFDKTVHGHVAMLAVLKAGAAYVPLDPGFPDERCAFICADAEVGRVLSVQRHAGRLAGLGVPGLCLDDPMLEAALAPVDTARLPSPERGAADALCYVIYTSGSTGRPKGVPIDHSQICNFVRVAAETYGYQADDQVYQGLTMAFDFAVEETWVPLSVGATLHPNQSGASLLGADLGEFLRRRHITALCCVPTALATLEEDLPELRLLIVSGEACPRDLVQRWATPARRMLNAYGSTETTVTATLERLDPAAPVTIGRPLPTYSVLILDPDAPRVLPAGETGEIVIAGAGVARGYLNRPEQTARVFLDDFVGVDPNPSGRLYRTGDLGRLREDGRVEYLGRIDTQVKIRGYRIELTEIESVLMAQPGVRQAVVHTGSAAPGQVELVAYWTVRPGWPDPPSPAGLREALRAQLPDYMVPRLYEQLDEMPMLASDKADRKALPAPRAPALSGGTEAMDPDERPRPGTEQTLAAALAAVLGGAAHELSATAHFFDELGANSLLMAGFGARLRRQLGRSDVTMRAIYAHPSLRALSTHLEQTAAPTTTATAAMAEPVPQSQVEAPASAPRAAYLGCGLTQVLMALAWLTLNFQALLIGLDWLLTATDPLQAYLRAALAGSALWALAVLLPVALKWLLVGRWQAGSFPLWSGRYLRWWAMRQLMRFNPMVLFAGSPLLNGYLRLLGAQVGAHAHIATPVLPVCTDLIRIGDDSLIGRQVRLPGCRAEAGRMWLGPVEIGQGCHVGDHALLDIDTRMQDGSQLGHASALLRGQTLAAGVHAHGVPAQPTPTEFCRVPAQPRPTALRRRLYALWQLLVLGGVSLPLPLWGLWLLSGEPGRRLEERFDLHLLGHGHAAHWADLGGVALGGALALLGGMTLWALLMATLPRLLSRAIVPGRLYRFYGLHHWLLGLITAWSNSRWHNMLAGDSPDVVAWLRAVVGYRFVGGIEQTGSNFGLTQQHDLPGLSHFGPGAMVSDGLTMAQVEPGPGGWRVGPTRLGARSFAGNAVLLPTGAPLGDNCLLATRVMVPLDGPLRENIGLLGSPAFEIPRSVLRDRPDPRWSDPAWRAQALRRKTGVNRLTMLLFVGTHCIGAALAAVVLYGAYVGVPGVPPALSLAAGTLAAIALELLWFVLVDRASLGWRPLEPLTCSILEPGFWRHERFWKLGFAGDGVLMTALRGTPFMGLLWRMLGVRVGRQLFDDGASIVEKTMTTLGDHVTLGDQSLIQGHSLEDGLFKFDRIVLGDQVTLGERAFVHYGVQVGAQARIAPESFVMKGEQLEAGSRWQGNPAQATGGAC